MPETLTTMFTNDDWRSEELNSTLPTYWAQKSASMTFIDYGDELYPLALDKAFEFMTVHANGRYTDRTMMSIRRAASRFAGTTAVERARMIEDESVSPWLPYVYVMETPFSWDEDTEIKRGGIVGMLVGLSNDEGEYRGVLAVAESARRLGAGSAILRGTFSFHTGLTMYAGQSNLNAMRLAASVGMFPVQIHSTTGTVQYSRNIPNSRR